MKASLENKFEPFDIKISIESKEDLVLLWCCLNSKISNILENSNNYNEIRKIITNADDPSRNILPLFRVIDNKVLSIGLKK